MEQDRIIFITTLRSSSSKPDVHRMIASLRTFGGSLRDCPFIIFTLPDAGKMDGEAIHQVPIHLPEGFIEYPFGPTVAACSQAESLVGNDTQSLVWVDDSCLFVQPPDLLDLGSSWDVAVRPVHIRNVGQRADQEMDSFWKGICKQIGGEPSPKTVESSVDHQILLPYFNSHCFAINPNQGLMVTWAEHFSNLIDDREFQTTACSDDLHRIFLFQALLSAEIAMLTQWERIRILPASYNYPLYLINRIPVEERPRKLNDLVSFTNEGLPVDPSTYQQMEISEPLRTWLTDHLQ